MTYLYWLALLPIIAIGIISERRKDTLFSKTVHIVFYLALIYLAAVLARFGIDGFSR